MEGDIGRKITGVKKVYSVAFLVAYDLCRHQGTISRHRRSRFTRVDLSSFFILNFFDPHMFKWVLDYFLLLFRLPGGFFPFRDPIREALLLCEPSYFYEYI